MYEEEYKQCEECGQWKTNSRAAAPNNRIERHHIIEKSHAQYMRNVPINFKDLCSQCHRLSKNAVHKDRGIDLRYKIELQEKLEELFNKEYYNVHQVKDKLKVTKSEAEKLVRHLGVYKEGYSSRELIFHMLGDRFYK